MLRQSSKTAGAFSILLLLSAAQASPSSNGTGPNGAPSPNTMLDCSAWSASHPTTSVAKATHVPKSSALVSNATMLNPAVSFEEYWCEWYDLYLAEDPEEDGIEDLFKGLPPGSETACLSMQKSAYSKWAITSTASTMSWSAERSPPCCDTYCDIEASAAQLYFWPSTRSAPNVTTMIGEGGATFTYPSLYLVYMDISATGECGVVGSTYARLTQSFAPGDILTLPASGELGMEEPLKVSDLFGNCTSRDPSESYTEPSCATQQGGSGNQISGLGASASCQAQILSYQSKVSYEQVHCFPSIYYPTTELKELDPAWTSCIAPKWKPVFDPPKTLVPAAAMAPDPTSAAHQATPAVPAPALDPPAVSKTPPPSQPTPAKGSGNDPSGKDPWQSSSNNDPPTNSAPGGDPPANKPPPSEPSDHAPPLNNPTTTKPAGNPSPNKPAGIDPQANGSPANDPPAGKPTTVAPVENGPSGNQQQGNDPPANDPQNQSQPGPANNPVPNTDPPANDPQNQSKPGSANNPVPNPSPSFAIPVPGGQPISGVVVNPSSIVVAGSTIGAGASAVQVQGHQVSLDPAASNVVVNGQAHALPSSPVALAWSNNEPVPTSFSTNVNGHSIQAVSTPGVVLVDGQSVTRGAGPVTIANTPVALHSNGDLVVVSSTMQGLLPTINTPPVVFTAAGQAATAVPNGVAIVGTTLTPNAPAITISGTAFSLGNDGMVVGTSTIPLPNPSSPGPITAAGQIVTPLPNGNVLISGTTMTPNAPGLTISGTPISLNTNGLMIGTSTIPLPSSPTTSSVMIAGQTIPLSLGANDVVIAGTTLTSGQSAITILGTPVSLGGQGLVIGSSTIGLASATASGGAGVGGYIFSGFGGGMATASSTSPVAFLGGGGRVEVEWRVCILGMGMVVGFIGIAF